MYWLKNRNKQQIQKEKVYKIKKIIILSIVNFFHLLTQLIKVLEQISINIYQNQVNNLILLSFQTI